PALRVGPGARLPALGLGRAERAGRRGSRHRVGGELRPGGRARAAHRVGAPRPGHRAALARDRRRDLRVHQRAHHHSGALMAEPTRTPEDKLPASPAAPEETLPWLEELPPRKIVAELDRYIVGQEVAKKAVAV